MSNVFHGDCFLQICVKTIRHFLKYNLLAECWWLRATLGQMMVPIQADFLGNNIDICTVLVQMGFEVDKKQIVSYLFMKKITASV
jgi:hypothetical protein